MHIRSPFKRSDDRWLGGVAAGLAHRLGIDPALTRSLFLLLTIAGGLGLIVYGLAWILLPDADGEVLAVELFRGRPQSGLVGGVVMVAIGLTRPFLWFWRSFLGYGSPTGPFWVLNVWALMIAALTAATALTLAWRARRLRTAMSLEMVTEPITQVFDGDPTEPMPSSSGGPAMGDDATGNPATRNAATAVIPRKTWFTQSSAAVATDGARPKPAREPRPPRLRRAKAGSRHVQMTLAATLLAIALIALLNDSVLSFRSIGQALGTVAVIWGVSVAVAAARGRSAGGTSLVATLVVLACAPALAVISIVPAETLPVDVTRPCPRLLSSEPIVCAISADWQPLRIDGNSDNGGPFTFSTGIGAAYLEIDPDEPMIIDINVTFGSFDAHLPGWTLVANGMEQVLGSPKTYTDDDGSEYQDYPMAYEYMTPGAGSQIITLISPTATRGISPEVHLNLGMGSIHVRPSYEPTDVEDVSGSEAVSDTSDASESTDASAMTGTFNSTSTTESSF